MLLNLDAGEDPREPDELWATADVLCVACGGHAGDAASMTRVVSFVAGRERPRLGAHPSYPDRDGFGRRTLSIDPIALARALATQCRELAAIASAHGVTVNFLKPHGALYHDAASSPSLAKLVVDVALSTLGASIALIGPLPGIDGSRTALRDAAAARGLVCLREGFADRRMHPDGSLVPRSEPDALITDPAECAMRAQELAGTVDTICVHSDTPNALAIANAVRTALHGG